MCYNDPESHPFITEEEKAYIYKETNCGEESAKRQKTVPWHAILTSGPVFAYVFARVIYFLLLAVSCYMFNFIR